MQGYFSSPIKPDDVRAWIERCKQYSGCSIHFSFKEDDQYEYRFFAEGDFESRKRLFNGTRHLIKWEFAW